jgi:hypothetical protein
MEEEDREYSVIMWTEFKWLRIGPTSSYWEHGKEFYGFISARNFLTL